MLILLSSFFFCHNFNLFHQCQSGPSMTSVRVYAPTFFCSLFIYLFIFLGGSTWSNILNPTLSLYQLRSAQEKYGPNGNSNLG